ncbi:major facilitator superfamily domain-containing protein [Blakeslea trispora]|nr:major facilitator superfamily domain-containing protein [Blakeslea trispora]
MPYWTSLVDRTGEYRRIMIRNMLVALGCIWSIAFVPLLSEQDWVRILLTSIGCFGYAFFGYPVIAALVDAITLRVLADRKDLYGRQKIGVPIGFASSVFLTGFLIEKFHSPYALFVVFGAFAILFILTIVLIDLHPTEYEPVSATEGIDYGATTPPLTVQIKDDDDGDSAILTDENQPVSLWYLLQTPESIQFFTFVILLGSTFAVIQAFLYLFFEHDIEGGTTSMLGLFGPLGSSTEIVCFFFSKQIFHWMGPNAMLILSQCLIIYRCLVYMIAAELKFGAWLVTVTQLLHGMGFSLAWSAGALQADRIAPPHLKSSAQGLLNMAYNGVSGINVLLTGYIYEAYGSKAMWGFTFVLGILSIFIYQSVYLRKTVFTWAARLVRQKMVA